MGEDPVTEELRLEQVARERAERQQVTRAVAPEEEDQHARRAEKAGYLREKLEERAEAERATDRPEEGAR